MLFFHVYYAPIKMCTQLAGLYCTSFASTHSTQIAQICPQQLFQTKYIHDTCFIMSNHLVRYGMNSQKENGSMPCPLNE